MKRSIIAIFLLFISLLIPLNLAYLYHDYYEDLDFLFRKHYAAQDDEDLLTVLKKNPRIVPHPEQSAQHFVTFLLELPFQQVSFLLPTPDIKNLDLRC